MSEFSINICYRIEIRIQVSKAILIKGRNFKEIILRPKFNKMFCFTLP